MSNEDRWVADDRDKARTNWERYRYGITRGHRDYTDTAKRLEGVYLGGGEQWSEEDRAILFEQMRPAYEINHVKPAVDAATGYQINNRMDISFRPRSGDATKELAEVRSKIAMQIAHNTNLHWRETEVFMDGMIQQRGYYDVRMSFDDHVLGELSISVLDPLDVMPDPDAKSYSPEEWADVIVMRWMSLDEIEGMYGKDARKAIEDGDVHFDSDDFGEHDLDSASRNKFGNDLRHAFAVDAVLTAVVRRYRVVDRQYWVRELADVLLYASGDFRVLTGNESEDVMQAVARGEAVRVRKRVRRVRWTVSTEHTLLHDDWSPYDRFTVIPFFPYFRRGKTRGMVDNAADPQAVLNKAVSQYIHIINTTANSGWQLEEGQLTNMSTQDLMEHGAMSGLVLERQKGTPPLTKIQPNTVPQGFDRIIDRAVTAIRDVTVPDAMRGGAEGIESGVAIQSRQHAAQQQLAVPLDNLARTRTMLARWIDYAMTRFYDTHRIMRITREGIDGTQEEEKIDINLFDPESGAYFNDMTAGEYDVVISEQPLQITFQNSQFQQVLEMIRLGLPIPPARVVRYSNLSDRNEIAEEISKTGAPPDPLQEELRQIALEQAKANLAKTQAETSVQNATRERVSAEAVNKSVEGMYSATQAASNIAVQPGVAPLADTLLRSAGFMDKDASPIIPVVPQGVAAVMPEENSSPLTPANPATGMNRGIEGGEV